MDVEIIVSKTVPTEYYCHVCQQLRLSLNKDKSMCFNCGSTWITVGEIGSLDKQALKEIRYEQ